MTQEELAAALAEEAAEVMYDRMTRRGVPVLLTVEDRRALAWRFRGALRHHERGEVYDVDLQVWRRPRPCPDRPTGPLVVPDVAGRDLRPCPPDDAA